MWSSSIWWRFVDCWAILQLYDEFSMQRTLLPRETCFYFKQYSQCQLFWRKRHLTRVPWWLITGDQVILCVACQCHGCIWVPESWLVLIPSSKSTAQLRSSHPFIGFNFRQPRIKTRHLTLAELSDTDSRSAKWADIPSIMFENAVW